MRLIICFFCLLALTGCGVSTASPTTPVEPILPTETPTILPTEVGMTPKLLYPAQEHEVQTGQSIRFLAQVVADQGEQIEDASVKVTVFDGGGAVVGSVPLLFSDKAYRSDLWSLPERAEPGEWTLQTHAQLGTSSALTESHFRVSPSTSLALLEKYGFWIDAPDLRGIVPVIMAERGDAQNGMLRWGGTLIAQHILPANWLEINWRTGEYPLDTEEEAKKFLTDVVGHLGFTPIRLLGPFERIQFNQWEAWKVGGRGQFAQDKVEWVVFYAPEADKTFSIGTTVVQPPSGIDPHAALRQSFEIVPGLQPDGKADEPLIPLLPGPVLVSPQLGDVFIGVGAAPRLEWLPVKELEEDEYYRVDIDWNWGEANNLRSYTTRETNFEVPEQLYEVPSCEVFNWKVTLMRQPGTDEEGGSTGEEISYPSLYWYILWRYPQGETKPFIGGCPNAQY